ncbi:DNA recombination protein RmuC [Motilibacter peucedani]|nr:DNA recombination protein RmuC [Motilibacter peucedani]
MDVGGVLLLVLGVLLGLGAGVGLGVWVSSTRGLTAQALEARDRHLVELADARFRAAGAEASGELDRRQRAVGDLVLPVHEALGRMEAHLRALETSRAAAHAGLLEQVRGVQAASEQLRTETAALTGALRSPNARGRWGEMQLRRVVEVAGMLAHCDFDEQVVLATRDGSLRPDLVVRLAGGRSVAVDAKVPLTAYLEAVERTDPAGREERVRSHARALRAHVDTLARREYWSALQPGPELVVLFVPGEAFLAPALEVDPVLLDDAMGKGVLLATPTTLLTLLRTIAYGWQQESLAEGAREVVAAGRELHRRLGRLGSHLDKLGRSLTRSVTDFNSTVGSFERSVAPATRRLSELGLAGSGAAAEPAALDVAPRPVTVDLPTDRPARELDEGAA